MKVRPVETMPAPGYPDKYAEETRKALAAARPQRWLAAPVAAGLAATVALGLSGCGNTTEHLTDGETTTAPTTILASGIPYSTEYYTEYIIEGDFTTAPTTIPITSTTMGTSKTTQTTSIPLITTQPVVTFTTPGLPTQIPVTLGQNIALPKGVIPLFEYGEGIGSFGCVSTAAPYFMPEDEAFAILQAAFSEAGVALEQGASTIKRATLPVTDSFDNSWEEKSLKTTKGALTPDGLANGIPVEFVSQADLSDWEKKQDDGMWISASTFGTKNAARTLAENNPGLLVFYDPVAHADYERLWDMEQKKGESDEAFNARWQAIREQLREESKAESQQLLRQQVRAFVQWLNNNGQ